MELSKPITSEDIVSLHVDRGEELTNITYRFEDFGIINYFSSLEAKIQEFEDADPTGAQRPPEWQLCLTIVKHFREKNREFQKTIATLQQDAKRGRAKMTMAELKLRLGQCEHDEGLGPTWKGRPAKKKSPTSRAATTRVASDQAPTPPQHHEVASLHDDIRELRAMLAGHGRQPVEHGYAYYTHHAHAQVPQQDNRPRCFNCDELAHQPGGTPCFILGKRQENGVTAANLCELHHRHGVHASNQTCTDTLNRRLTRGVTRAMVDEDQHNRYLQRQRTRKRKQSSGKGRGKGRGRGYGRLFGRGKGRGKGRGRRAYAVTAEPPYHEPKASESEEEMDDMGDDDQTEDEPEI